MIPHKKIINWKKIKFEFPNAYKKYCKWKKDNNIKRISIHKAIEFFDKYKIRLFAYPGSTGYFKVAYAVQLEPAARGWDSTIKFLEEGYTDRSTALMAALIYGFEFLEQKLKK